MSRLGPLLLAALLVAACSGTSRSADDVPTVEAGEEAITPPRPVKLDVLFVIDNSSSVCQERWKLGREFGSFVTALQAQIAVDLLVAVTTTDIASHAGQFVNSPSQKYPFGCVEARVWPCHEDQECADEFGGGWECKVFPAEMMYNINGSVNSSCIFRCADDVACCMEFCHVDECGVDTSCLDNMCSDTPTSDCAFECSSPDGNGGCVGPPDTTDCPATVPAVLTNDNADLFRCLASVPQTQPYTANLEQGLKASWMALDPSGVNAEQSSSFLRTEAYLLVVVLSDEDDCSIDEDFCSSNWPCESDDDCHTGTACKVDEYLSELAGEELKFCCGGIKKDYYSSCSLFGEHSGTENHGDPMYSLAPVTDFFDRLGSLKADPAKVMFAAITGDGLVDKDDKEAYISDECLQNAELATCLAYDALKAEAPGCSPDPRGPGCKEFFEAKLGCIRECYLTSKGATGSTALNTYVCYSELGRSDAGLRYIRLAEMFGPNGMVSNICSPEEMEKVMTDIAKMVVSVVK
jgi:hypothetical protein